MNTHSDSSKETIGKSLGRIPSGVAILTTQHEEQSGAMLVSWFQQAGFAPPLITVAIKKDRPIEEIIRASQKFALNILHTGQKEMLVHFGKGFSPGENPFQGIELEAQSSGLPVLKKTLCFLECTVRQVFDAEDHHLYLGEVFNAGSEEEGQPMVHIRRNGFNY